MPIGVSNWCQGEITLDRRPLPVPAVFVRRIVAGHKRRWTLAHRGRRRHRCSTNQRISAKHSEFSPTEGWSGLRDFQLRLREMELVKSATCSAMILSAAASCWRLSASDCLAIACSRAGCARKFIRFLRLAENLGFANHHRFQTRSNAKQMLCTFGSFVAIKGGHVFELTVELSRDATRDFLRLHRCVRRSVNFHAITRTEDQCFRAT